MPASADLVATLRPRLEEQLKSVLARHAKIDAHLHNTDRELPQDWSDLAQTLENDEVLEALDDHARAEIDGMQYALRRMDDGSYGVCANCGEDIAPRRLQAMPMVTRCFTCASSQSVG